MNELIRIQSLGTGNVVNAAEICLPCAAKHIDEIGCKNRRGMALEFEWPGVAGFEVFQYSFNPPVVMAPAENVRTHDKTLWAILLCDFFDLSNTPRRSTRATAVTVFCME